MQIHDLNTKALTNPAYVAFDDGTDTYKADFKAEIDNAAADAVADADLTDNTVAFTSGDAASPTAWTAVSVLTSGLTIKALFNRISTMIKNVRWLYSKLGTTDISSIGGGTVTGAISSLNSNIGSIYDGVEPSTGIAVPSDGSGATVINHVTLANAGKYLIIGRANFPANANGFRTIGLSADAALKLYQSNVAASAGNINMYMQVVWYTTVTANTTINLIARQTSGSSLAVNSRMTAVRLK